MGNFKENGSYRWATYFEGLGWTDHLLNEDVLKKARTLPDEDQED
jgi:hypothetical protein